MALTSYGDEGFSRYLKSAFSRHLGHDPEDFDKPVIGICDTSSEVNRCHSHLGPMIEAIKRGVTAAGGTALEFPVISLGEMFISPTTMLYRNLAAMDAEEMIRAQPIDGVVLIGGCDKMTPALLMGAASADKPAIMFTGGPMSNGEHKGKTLGACTDCRFFWQEYKAGTIGEDELNEINAKLAPTAGHCMVMGSASTMAACSEALGMMLPGGAAIPAVLNERLSHAQHTGKAIVELVRNGTKPSDIMTRGAFENAIRVLMAIGGSTNAVIHLIAIARRLGIEIKLDDFHALSATTPFLANLRPAGKYQLQDFYYAGGVPALMQEMSSLLHLEERSVSGKTIGENISGAKTDDAYRDIIRPFDDPLYSDGGITVVKGNLAPDGAIIKSKAATERLLKHRGKAVVFHSLEDMETRINDPQLEVTPDSVLVMQNAGPVGAPGMPEAGMIPIPRKLLQAGVRDMVRLSDARMSGTAFGTVVLHVAPEAAVGGPLALVRDGDEIELDAYANTLTLHVPEEELRRRKAEWKPPAIAIRGYTRLYQKQVMQANKGCDFDFL